MVVSARHLYEKYGCLERAINIQCSHGMGYNRDNETDEPGNAKKPIHE